ncbi:BamA/TamA family outer membrane protein [Agarivorans sp. Z349TD_8]|uniref:BamA/TamA family outer membrane protein n=1 Tax=Agarivorans sp. Z349TD_8 TaxID=3421434 RepID=UPI003D7D4077
MNVTLIDDAQHQRSGPWTQVIPYGFYTENLEWGVGVGVGSAGQIQANASLIATAMVTSNDSWMGYLYSGDYQLPFADRVFFDTSIYQTNYTRDPQYIDGNSEFNGETAGSNDSNKNNRIYTHTQGQEYRARFRYLLPIGDGKNSPIHTFKIRQGQVLSGYEAGAKRWDPLTSGRTIIQLEPYYWQQDVGEYNQLQASTRSMGLKFELEYDNRNYNQNPTAGSHQRISITHDWGSSAQTSWSMWEFSAAKYISLPKMPWLQNHVLALNVATADTPSWNKSSDIKGESRFHRPAWFAGATLGGMNRLKGYETARYHSRSMLYYSAEYRFTPHWNPLPKIPVVNWFNVPAWYWVAFAELGRVADEYSLTTLHQDMKYSIGGSLRIMLEGVVLRADFASSGEDKVFRLGINHPY